MEEIPEPDVILVCSGGGGLFAGVAVAVKLSGKKTRVFGVEPEGGITGNLRDLPIQKYCLYFVDYFC